MTTRYANFKKLAGLAALATAVTAAGWGLGSGTAQADTKKPDPHVVHVVHVFNRIDRHIDRHEGSPIDRIFDHFFDHR
jgi:hypothetical protein